MNLLDAFRKCQICRKPRKKDSAAVVINASDGERRLKVCDECERILDMSNKAAHGKGEEYVEEPL